MSGAATLIVERPGLLTTVQDRGRWGGQADGVPVAGPMDPYAHRLANALVGNDPLCATLELTLVGPTLRAEGDVVVAAAGAEFDAFVDDRPVDLRLPTHLRSGARLRVEGRRRGARAYLAVAGGILTPPVLGSRATHLVCGMGGLDGRVLVGGDVLPVGAHQRVPRRHLAETVPWVAEPPGLVRVMLGPQDAWFSADTIARFLDSPFTVSTQSNRMGYRLEGPSIVAARRDELLSEPLAIGAIQVPAGGVPILLMADRATAGGYPKIATVIAADLPVVGQLGPGDVVRFTACSRAEATAALIARERALLRAAPEVVA